MFPKTHSLVRFIYIGLAIQAQFVSSGLHRPKFNRTLTPKKSPRKWGERYGRACHGCGTVAKLSAGWVAPGDVGSRRGTRSTGLFVKCGNYSCPRIRATTAPILPFTDEEAGRGGRVPLLHWEKVCAIHHSIFLIA